MSENCLSCEKKLKEYLDEKRISEKVQAMLFPLCSYRKYDPETTIIEIDKRSEYIFLVLSGIVRGFYIDESGNERTKCFSMEKRWCGSYNLISDMPSPFCVESLEKCELAQFNAKKLRSLIEQNTELARVYDENMREAFFESEKRMRYLTEMNAGDRYLNFLKENCELAGRVKQGYIASYLGITPSSLSRIKRNLGISKS